MYKTHNVPAKHEAIRRRSGEGNRTKGGFVQLVNGEEIEVSVRRKDEFIKMVTQGVKTGE